MADAPYDSSAGSAVKSVSSLKTVDDLVAKMASLRRGRQPLEQQWKLNLAFYKGRQYSFYNRASRRISTLPVEDGDKPRYRVRLVSNQILTGAHSLLAKFTKTKPVITASPGSSGQSDVKAAQMAERLFEYWWDDLHLDDKLEEALLWSIIAGQGYWLVSWDPHANKSMKFTLDPQGRPITDDALKDAFHTQLQKAGIEPREKVIYMGDVAIQPKSPFQVWMDPAAPTVDEAKFAICEWPFDVDEIKARWNKDVVPDAIPTAPDVALPYQHDDNRMDKTQKCVYYGYFKPTPSLPKGRFVVWMESPNVILEDGPWPFPFEDLPIIKFPGLRNPGQIYDGSHVEQAIPLQKELNRTISQIVEYKNLTLRPRVWAPTGSLNTRLTTEPGAVYFYNPVANLKPEVEQLPAMPPYVFEHLGEISSRLKEIFALTDVSEGSVPPNVEAGIAIDLLQELSADRLAPTIKLIEKCLARAGQQMLTLAQKYYIEPRLLTIRGSGGSTQVKRFTQADIAGGVNINVETGSGLPRTRAGRQAQIERYVQNGIIPADKAWKYMDSADMKQLGAMWQADEDQAYREIDKLINNEPINPEAAQQAQQQVQQGTNPDTQQPFQSPQEVQAFIQKASLQPTTGENFDVHLDTLGLFMKGVEFDSLPMDARQRMIDHWNYTLQVKMSLPAPAEPGKTNVNLQIKSTSGPTGAAKILNHAGIAVTEEEMAEPPLETWVSDSVDDPDTDASGPGQEANQLSQVAATMLDSHTKLADAQVASQITKSKHASDQIQQHVKISQDADLHEEKVREASAKADLAEKKVRESSFKPKPAAPKGK